MSVRFECACGKKLKAADDKIGKRVLCPDCGEPVKVPAQDAVAVEAIDRTGEGGETLQDSAQTARELLKLTKAAARSETRQADAEQARRPREEQEKPPTSEVVKYFAIRGGLPLAGILLGCLLLYWLASLFYGFGADYPELYPVSGTVTLNGQALEGAVVTFRSSEAFLDGKQVAESVGITDSDGQYTLEYVPGVRGAVPGKHFVEIRRSDPNTGIEMLPAQFHQETTLTANVTADKKTGYDFSLELEQ